jgi:hypothetical protein
MKGILATNPANCRIVSFRPLNQTDFFPIRSVDKGFEGDKISRFNFCPHDSNPQCSLPGKFSVLDFSYLYDLIFFALIVVKIVYQHKQNLSSQFLFSGGRTREIHQIC